jgi:N6-L-threonylcarbamoyladenine synthase
MLHIAFETSCDDTSVAVFQDTELLALVTRSQIKEHEETQWVVPEVAARLHANVIFSVLDEALTLANITLEQLSFISCTKEPGLIPSLLVWKTVAKTLADSLNISLIWVHHIEWHMFANFLERPMKSDMFPAVVLTVSGGHNDIYKWVSPFEWELLGQTRDDAAWEAFDKVAKSLWLGFPGGPLVAKYAKEYSEELRAGKCEKSSLKFPIPLLEKDSLDFSFSWLKSAVKREIDIRKNSQNGLTLHDIKEISYIFEQTMVEVLISKLARAVVQTGTHTVMLAGWVSANDFLRLKIEQFSQEEGLVFYAPVKRVYSMDNAAMIGIRAYYEYKK